MPCYVVQTTSVEISIKNVDLFKSVLEKLGYYVFMTDDKNFLSVNKEGVNRITFNLKTQTAQVGRYQQERLNEMKRAYSLEVVKQIAKKKKWAIKMKAKNKMVARKY
jgi:hypothetical protein